MIQEVFNLVEVGEHFPMTYGCLPFLARRACSSLVGWIYGSYSLSGDGC